MEDNIPTYAPPIIASSTTRQANVAIEEDAMLFLTCLMIVIC
jgi:hypothetical protein